MWSNHRGKTYNRIVFIGAPDNGVNWQRLKELWINVFKGIEVKIGKYTKLEVIKKE